MSRVARTGVAVLCFVGWSAAVAQSASDATPLTPRTPSFAAPACESVVVVRCPRPANAASISSEKQRLLDDFAMERFAVDDDTGRVVIYGTAAKPKVQRLREALEGAAPPLGGMTFRTVPNGDGTQCTCVGPPCVINCCVCSGGR